MKYKDKNKFEKNWIKFSYIWIPILPAYIIIIIIKAPTNIIKTIAILTFLPFWIWIWISVKKGLMNSEKRWLMKKEGITDELSKEYGIKLTKAKGQYD